MEDEERIIEEEFVEGDVQIYGAYHSIQPLQFSCCCRSGGGQKRTFGYVICQIFPFLSWVPRYRASFLFHDILTGVTTGLAGLPECVAMAFLAGLPLQYGLYSSFIATFVHVFFGTCKDVELGISTAVALLVHQSVSRFPDEDAVSVALLITFWTGLVQLAMGVFQLGYLVDFISLAVSKSFVFATAMVIIADQFKYLLGLHVDSHGFIMDLVETFRNIAHTNIWDFLVGLTCILVIIALQLVAPPAGWVRRRWYDHAAFHVLRAVSLGRWCIALVVASLIETALRSQHIHVVTVSPDMEGGFPSVKPPDFQFGNHTAEEIVGGLGPNLIIIPLISILELGAVIKHVAQKQRYNVNSREFRALGMGNFAGSFFGSLPVSASLSMSELGLQCKGQTLASGLASGTVGILAVLYVAPFLSYIPTAGIAAVIICTVIPTMDFAVLGQIWHIRKGDLVPYFATLLSCLLLGVEYGILIGVFVSVALILFPVARPPVAVYQTRGEIIITPYGIVNFPAIRYIRKLVMDHIDRSEAVGKVVFDGSHWTDLDFTVAVSINDMIKEIESLDWTISFNEINDVVSGTFQTPSSMSWPSISEDVAP